jgi:cytosine/adenosine deaminase-related metal-dependent hydrolase
MTKVFHADAVILGDASPLRDGAVVVDDARRVLDLGAAADVLSRHAGAPVERVRGVVAPWLVNAHTHLELSCLRGRVPGGRGFVQWVDKLVTTRTEAAEDEVLEGIDAGVTEILAHATSAVGEVTNGLGAVAALKRASIAAILFHEMFGMLEERATKSAHDMIALARAAEGHAPSPHTLYTTHPSAVRLLLDAAREAKRRVTIHLAEHPAERSAIELGSGPSAEWLKSRLRVPEEALFFPKRALFDYAAELGVLRENTLLVHLTDARRDELLRVRDSGAHVVLCPRSNLFIEARLPPLLAVLDAGIEPALGTDSLASNTSLDVLAEARALRDRFPSVAPELLVRMGTSNGARALGLAHVGRIAVGASPGLFAVEGALAPTDDPCAFLLANVKSPRVQLVRPGAPS